MNQQATMPVRAIMSRTPIIVNGLATVSEAMALMRENNVSALVIDRRNPSDEYGMVVISDIAKNIVATNRSPDRVSIYEIMSKPLLTIEAEMEVRYAVRLLTRFEVSRSIVTDKGTLCGFVTLRDLVFSFMTPSAPPSLNATEDPA